MPAAISTPSAPKPAYKYYVVYQYASDSHSETFGNVPKYISRFVPIPGGFQLKETLSSQHFSYRYVITAVGKNNNESDLSEIAIFTDDKGFHCN